MPDTSEETGNSRPPSASRMDETSKLPEIALDGAFINMEMSPSSYATSQPPDGPWPLHHARRVPAASGSVEYFNNLVVDCQGGQCLSQVLHSDSDPRDADGTKATATDPPNPAAEAGSAILASALPLLSPLLLPSAAHLRRWFRPSSRETQ